MSSDQLYCNAVVFDCGDTLVHLMPPREVIFCDTAAQLGLTFRLQEVSRAYELVEFARRVNSSKLRAPGARRSFYRTFNTLVCVALGVESYADRLEPLLFSAFDERRHWRLFDDTAPVLEALGERFPLFVLANWDSQLSEILGACGVREHFQGVFSSESLGSEKPLRSCFESFLQATGIKASGTVYVGNEYAADIVGARVAGLTPILLDLTDRYPSADCVRIRTLSELPGILIAPTGSGIAAPNPSVSTQ